MKMKILLICFFFLPILLFSQHSVKKQDTIKTGGLYLDASGGLSLPIGAYASSDLKSSGSGFATPGFLAQLNLDWVDKSHFGLALQYTLQSNPLKSAVKNDTLPGMGQALGTNSWTNHYLMAGLVFLKFFHNVYFEGRALVGFIISSSPLFKTVDPVTHTTSTNAGIGPAYSAQFGIGYKVSPRLTIKTSVEYILANPKIHHQYGSNQILDTIKGILISSAPVTVESQRNVSTFLFKAGVVLKLSK
jgi:hypothetical protein